MGTANRRCCRQPVSWNGKRLSSSVSSTSMKFNKFICLDSTPRAAHMPSAQPLLTFLLLYMWKTSSSTYPLSSQTPITVNTALLGWATHKIVYNMQKHWIPSKTSATTCELDRSPIVSKLPMLLVKSIIPTCERHSITLMIKCGQQS